MERPATHHSNACRASRRPKPEPCQPKAASDGPSSVTEVPTSKPDLPKSDAELPRSEAQVPKSETEVPKSKADGPPSEPQVPRSEVDLSKSKADAPESAADLGPNCLKPHCSLPRKGTKGRRGGQGWNDGRCHADDCAKGKRDVKRGALGRGGMSVTQHKPIIPDATF